MKKTMIIVYLILSIIIITSCGNTSKEVNIQEKIKDYEQFSSNNHSTINAFDYFNEEMEKVIKDWEKKYNMTEKCETEFFYHDGEMMLTLIPFNKEIFIYNEMSEDEMYGFQSLFHYKIDWQTRRAYINNKYFYMLIVRENWYDLRSEDRFKKITECIDFEKYEVFLLNQEKITDSFNPKVVYGLEEEKQNYKLEKADKNMILDGFLHATFILDSKKSYSTFDEFLNDPFVFEDRITFNLKNTDFLKNLLENANKYIEQIM